VGAEIDALGIVGKELGSGGGSMVTEIVVDDAEDRSQGSEAFADRPIAAEDHAVFFKGVGDRIEDEAVGIDFAGGGAVGSTGAFDQSRNFHDEVGMPACGPYCGDPGLGQGLAHGYVAAVVDDNAQAGECLGDADGFGELVGPSD